MSEDVNRRPVGGKRDSKDGWQEEKRVLISGYHLFFPAADADMLSAASHCLNSEINSEEARVA